MRVLVTGAGGFVGRHVACALATRGATVYAGVRRDAPELSGRPGLTVVRADLARGDPLPAPLDAVVHCAAAIPAACPEEDELYRINVEAARHVFGQVGRAGARSIVNCSSMSAFGRIETDLVDPETPVRAPGAYGRAKLESERLLAEAAARFGLCGVSIRLPGVVGAGSHDNFLSGAMRAILSGGTVTARSPDAPFNNIVHVDDLVGFVAHLLEWMPPGHRVTTIAADDPLPIRQVISRLFKAADRPERVAYEPGGRPFLISPEPARALGYRVPTVAASLDRFARDCVAPA
jgi:nucleoside-diphosphate-sugar epimerase